MIQAIFYKEWIKTLVFVAGNPFYDRNHRIFHASYWSYHCHTGNRSFMGGNGQKDAIFIDLLQFVPLLTGILLAAVQFSLRCNASV